MKRTHNLERLKSYVEYLEKLANGYLEPLSQTNFSEDAIGQIGKNLQQIEQRDEFILKELSCLLESLSTFDLSFKSQNPAIYCGQYEILLQNIQTMLLKLVDLFTSLKQISADVDGGSKQITLATQELAQGVITEDTALQELNEAIVTIQVAIENTAKETSQIATLCEETNHKIENAGNRVNSLSIDVLAVNKQAGSLDKILQQMKQISDQINLLSLNAQIEAARLGQKGAGFSVIANQMEDLNNVTIQSLKESEKIVKQILTPLQAIMENVNQLATISSAIVAEAGNITRSNDEVANLSSQQSVAAKQITRNIQSITEISENNAAVSEELIATSEELYSLVTSLDSLLTFKQ